MSTFCGYFQDLKYTSVDRFEGNENLQSKVYFLSHCHSDHMRGLGSKSFQDRLINNADIFLYASHVSVTILTGLYSNIAHKFKGMPIKDSILIEIPENNICFTVTAIPAGHCPGSVMFLFESDKNILYTGDIRLNASDIAKFRTVFHKYDNIKKRIDVMYLDTTFLSPSYLSFPSRKDSFKTLMQLVGDWIAEGSHYVINLQTSAKYGHEYLFSELSKSLNMPIHVNEEVYNVYKHFPDMDNRITRDGKITQIHATCMGYNNKICVHNNKTTESGDSLEYKIRNIKTCALSFTNYKTHKEVCRFNTYHQLYRVCYSCHSSYEELVEFIDFFAPKQIKPCVVPANKKNENDLYSYINKILSLSEDSLSIDTSHQSVLKEPLFQLVEEKEMTSNKNVMISEDLSLDSPPQSNKRLRF